MPVLENARYERFAQNRAKGETVDASYTNAGFSANRGNAARLNANESIKKRIEELQAQAAGEVVLTVMDIARQLDEDRQFARDCEVPGAAVQATMGKAKVLGLMVDKVEHTGKDGGAIKVEDMTDKEIARRIAFQLAKGQRAANESPASGE